MIKDRQEMSSTVVTSMKLSVENEEDAKCLRSSLRGIQVLINEEEKDREFLTDGEQRDNGVFSTTHAGMDALSVKDELVTQEGIPSLVQCATEEKQNQGDINNEQLARECDDLRQILTDRDQNILKLNTDLQVAESDKNHLSSEIAQMASQLEEKTNRIRDKEKEFKNYEDTWTREAKNTDDKHKNDKAKMQSSFQVGKQRETELVKENADLDKRLTNTTRLLENTR
ncbi:unnamed protein product [Didymodactylos carnosus]|uniref:Uncharacterized protein n=1 Tax=Didymodactylos carnosus TaxID=1234261 RepID=A0A814RIH7_9BILA|nr:unnamed protein product [Didymodactylos carnosus]CAF3898180.1 unnamed protein product [Didymodactylos carnosus]